MDQEENSTFFYKNVVFTAKAENSYFSVDFKLKTVLVIHILK